MDSRSRRKVPDQTRFRMRVRVQLFAVARQLQGADVVELDLPEDATVADLKSAIPTQAPKLAGLLGQLQFAVNEDYAGERTRIGPADKVACIPPVSGG